MSISKSFCIKCCKAVPPRYVCPLPTTPHWQRKPKGGRLQAHRAGAGHLPDHQQHVPRAVLISPGLATLAPRDTRAHTQLCGAWGLCAGPTHTKNTALRLHQWRRQPGAAARQRVLGDLVAGLMWLVPWHPQRAHGLQQQHFHLPGSPGNRPFQTGVHLKKQMGFSPA